METNLYASRTSSDEARADRVVHPNCFIELGMTHHVEDRRKGLAQDGASMLRHLTESRMHVISVLAPDFRDTLAAMQDTADLAHLC